MDSEKKITSPCFRQFCWFWSLLNIWGSSKRLRINTGQLTLLGYSSNILLFEFKPIKKIWTLFMLLDVPSSTTLTEDIDTVENEVRKLSCNTEITEKILSILRLCLISFGCQFKICKILKQNKMYYTRLYLYECIDMVLTCRFVKYLSH